MSKALKRQGRFVVLKQHVITSARKARLYPLREMIPIVLKIMVRGPNGAKRRQGLEFWYESRREKVVPDSDAMDDVKNNPTEAREALGDL